MTIKAGILGTGYYLPSTILTNNELLKNDFIASRYKLPKEKLIIN